MKMANVAERETDPTQGQMCGAQLQEQAGGAATAGDVPSFLSRPGDDLERPVGQQEAEGKTCGAWATGKVDWSPTGGTTGCQPVVDAYSVTRYSDAEWRKHNEEVLCASSDDLHRVNMAEFTSKRAIGCTASSADKAQYLNNQRLVTRDHEILRWKTEMEHEIIALTEEIKLLIAKREQTRRAEAMLSTVKNIVNECIARRAFREGHDLQRDRVEEELIKECSLVREVNEIIDKGLGQINEQLARTKAMKNHLECDWSDKVEAHELEASGIALRTCTTTALYKPAATRFPADQSSPLGWERETKEILTIAETVRAQSCELRTLLDGPILQDAIRNLKVQADKVDIALTKSIADTQQCVKAMTNELEVVVKRNAESESIILELQNSLRGLDKAMKVAQTRLDNLQKRPKTENTRDCSQLGLVDEVKNLAEMTASLKGRLSEAEESLLNLIKSRKILEKELQNKLKTIEIDRNRCQAVRAYYPSATALSGF